MTDDIIQDQGFIIKKSKFDYFFGRVTSTPDNTQRSLQNLRELKRLGIEDNQQGQEKLLKIFQKRLNAVEIIENRKINEYGISIVRKVEVKIIEIMGEILICYFYPNHDLNAIPQVTSIIPKIYN